MFDHVMKNIFHWMDFVGVFLAQLFFGWYIWGVPDDEAIFSVFFEPTTFDHKTDLIRYIGVGSERFEIIPNLEPRNLRPRTEFRISTSHLRVIKRKSFSYCHLIGSPMSRDQLKMIDFAQN